MGFSECPELKVQLCRKGHTYGKGRSMNTQMSSCLPTRALSPLGAPLSPDWPEDPAVVKASAGHQCCPGRQPQLTMEAPGNLTCCLQLSHSIHRIHRIHGPLRGKKKKKEGDFFNVNPVYFWKGRWDKQWRQVRNRSPQPPKLWVNVLFKAHEVCLRIGHLGHPTGWSNR